MATASIISAIAGLVTAIGGVAALFVHRRRRRKAKPHTPPPLPK